MKNLIFAILVIVPVTLFSSCDDRNDPGYEGPSGCSTGGGNNGGGGNGGGGNTGGGGITSMNWSEGMLMGKITSVSDIPVSYNGDFIPDRVDADGDGYFDPLQTAQNSEAMNKINYYFAHFYDNPSNQGYEPQVLVYPSLVWNPVYQMQVLVIGSYYLGRM